MFLRYSIIVVVLGCVVFLLVHRGGEHARRIYSKKSRVREILSIRITSPRLIWEMGREIAVSASAATGTDEGF